VAQDRDLHVFGVCRWAQVNQAEELPEIMKAKVRTTMTSSCRAGIVPGQHPRR